MTLYFRWTDKKEDSVDNFKKNILKYTLSGKPSEKAFWVFDANSTYKPEKNITSSRFLMVLNFGGMGDKLISNAKRIDFEDGAFRGEKGHKSEIIVKSNEKGAYGIGAIL